MSDTPRGEHDPGSPEDPEGTLAVGEPTAEPDDTDDGTGDPELTGEQTDGPPPAWRRRIWLILPWVLVVLAVAVAVVSTAQLQEHRATEAAREDVERAAGTFMLTLTTWDATDGMGQTREELVEAGTDRFAGEVDELFGTTEDLAGLAEIGARSEGDVRRLFVQEIDDERATALVVVVQRLTSDVSEPETNARYAEVELLERDGRWLVDDVELLIDVTEQQAGSGPVAPDDPLEQDEPLDDEDAS